MLRSTIAADIEELADAGCGQIGLVQAKVRAPATLDPAEGTESPCIVCKGIGRFWSACLQHPPVAEPMDLANIHLALLQRMGLEIDEFAPSERSPEELAG